MTTDDKLFSIACVFVAFSIGLVCGSATVSESNIQKCKPRLATEQEAYMECMRHASTMSDIAQPIAIPQCAEMFRK